MKKIIVIGCPGSGKSTFSVALQKITGIELFHLDMMYWNADKTTVDKAVFRERLLSAMQNEEWIIDGNYGSTMEMRMKECNTVFFLDYPAEICIEGVRERMGKPRADMPWTETEEDREFMNFIINYNQESRPKVIGLLNKFSDRKIYIFKSRKQADDFLKSLNQ